MGLTLILINFQQVIKTNINYVYWWQTSQLAATTYMYIPPSKQQPSLDGEYSEFSEHFIRGRTEEGV